MKELCSNTVYLEEYLSKQERMEMDCMEVDRQIELILDDLVDQEIISSESDEVINAMEVCEQEWADLMAMDNIEIDEAPIENVLQLAKLAQRFKDKLDEVIRDELYETAEEIYENGKITPF